MADRESAYEILEKRILIEEESEERARKEAEEEKQRQKEEAAAEKQRQKEEAAAEKQRQKEEAAEEKQRQKEEEVARKAAEKETAAQSKRVKRAVKQTAGSAAGTIGRERGKLNPVFYCEKLLHDDPHLWTILLQRLMHY